MSGDLTLALGLLLVAGFAIGFVSALLGIGGGMLMVPALLVVLPLVDVERSVLMHVCEGTALAIMVGTSSGSTLAHARHGNVVWAIGRRVTPGIVVGVILGALLARSLASRVLELLFGAVLLVIAALMLFGFTGGRPRRAMPGAPIMFGVGSLIGFKSGLLGVGGGALSVPWLTWLGLPQREVSGTSASFTLPIAVVGATAFALGGLGANAGPFTLGFVFWPAVPIAWVATLLGTSLGARLAGRVPGRRLRVLFGLVVFGTGLTLLWRS